MCLLLCIWIHVYVCLCTCGDQRFLAGVFPIAFYLRFWYRVSQWKQSSTIQLNWVARESQRSLCPCLSSFGVTDACCHTWLFMHVLNSATQAFLTSAPLADQTISLFLRQSVLAFPRCGFTICLQCKDIFTGGCRAISGVFPQVPLQFQTLITFRSVSSFYSPWLTRLFIQSVEV